MQEIINFANKNRKIILIGTLILIVLLLILLIFFHSNRKKLERTLKEMGENFYQSYYKDLDSLGSEKEKFLKGFESKGLKINLDGLGQYDENEKLLSKMKNNKTKEECNKNNTKVIIYPKWPFGENDYKLDIELDCGF